MKYVKSCLIITMLLGVQIGYSQPTCAVYPTVLLVVVNVDVFVDRDWVHVLLGVRFRVQAEGWDSFRKLGIVHPVRLIRNIGSCGAIVESTGVEKLQSYKKN